jgi:hypothetical protein
MDFGICDYDDFDEVRKLVLAPPEVEDGTLQARPYLTTPEMNPGLRRGGLISFFRKQRAALPA